MPEDILTQLGGIGTLAPGTLLLALGALFIRAVMTGAIVPRRTHEDLREDYGRLRHAQSVDSETLKEISRAVAHLVDASRTTVQVAQAVQKVTTENREST